MTAPTDLDVIIVGGGLSGSLTAWALKQRAPSLRLALIEAAPRLGGNHTWSCFETDLEREQLAALEPLITYRWPRYRVAFPKLRRELPAGYCSITSDRLHAVVSPALGPDLKLGHTVDEIGPRHVRLATGEKLDARCVIDARGATTSPHLALGFQKFLGLEVELDAPHGETMPLIMDATVPQADGYRFVYTLPFSASRILIEDTYYSDGNDLAVDAIRSRIQVYAASKGWKIADVVREEHGVLPIILAGDIERHLAETTAGIPRIGLAAALFHPTTGYSLPDAVRTADLISGLAVQGPLEPAALNRRLEDFIRRAWNERAHFRLLNRLMFKAGLPERRYVILERFYGLDAGLIQRFYAARLTAADRARLLVGKPPVPILSALGCVSEPRMLLRLKAN